MKPWKKQYGHNTVPCERLLRELHSWVFHARATGLMVGDHLTICGRDTQADIQMVADLGLELTVDRQNRSTV